MTAVAPADSLAGTDRWADWDRFVESVRDTTFMQSSWWAEFRTLAGYSHFGAVLRSGGEIVGGALVQRFSYTDSGCFYYIPAGPILPHDETLASDVFKAVLEAIEDQRQAETQVVSHLRIEPLWPVLPSFVTGFQPRPVLGDPFMEPRDTLWIDLRATDDAILAQMKPKGRYNVRVAVRHGVTVVEDNSERGLADFQAIYGDTAERQNFGAKPADYFEELTGMLSSLGRGSLFFAEYNGVRVATALVVGFGQVATYFYGGSLPAFRHVMAPYLLHFEIMRRSREQGREWYDLWGIAPANVSPHPFEGITEFKGKFGGREIRFVPTLDYVFDPAAYGDYLATAKHW